MYCVNFTNEGVTSDRCTSQNARDPGTFSVYNYRMLKLKI